jgi:hypothetical protein
LRAGNAGIKFPKEFSGGGIEGEDFLGRRDAVEDGVDDDGAGLQAAGCAGVEGPGDLEIFHVIAIDLGEQGVVGVVEIAAIDGPVLIVLSEEGKREEEEGEEPWHGKRVYPEEGEKARVQRGGSRGNGGLGIKTRWLRSFASLRMTVFF